MKNTRYINLTKGFDPFSIKNTGMGFDKFIFKGGEPHIKLALDYFTDEVTIINISHKIESFNGLGMLAVAVSALKNHYKNAKLNLFLPYFPGARQDRLMVAGEPFTSAVYVKELHNMNFNSITSFDLHSDVVAGMFQVLGTTFVDLNNHGYVLEALKKMYPQRNAKTPILISPDAGSNKKIQKLSETLSKINMIDVVKCDKTRNVKNGLITNFEVYTDDLKGRDCVIVDDICDGGGTFLGLAAELKKKNAGKLYLVISHGIFSKGFDLLTTYFDGIYTTDSVDHLKYFNGVVPKSVNVIPFKNIKL